MSLRITQSQVDTYRDERYRRLPALRLKDEADAVRFLNEVGLSLLFSAKSIELPTLWAAICGEDRPVPNHHDDYELGLAWSWKDSIPERRDALYGKFLRKRPVFISLDLAPSFYALSNNFGEEDDYIQEYRDGRLSAEAKRIYEALLERGPLPTSELRRAAGITSKGSAGLFDRAVTELQMGFKIVKSGISDANRWKYCYVYDLFIRRFPDSVGAARCISSDDAAVSILTRHLRTVLVARPADVKRLFAWDSWRYDRTLTRMIQAGQLATDVRVENAAGDFVALNPLLTQPQDSCLGGGPGDDPTIYCWYHSY